MKKVVRQKTKGRKIASWIIGGVFGVLFAGLIALQITVNVSKKSNYGVPKIGGIQICTILTGSMEPVYKIGTAIIVEEVQACNLSVGDDVTFYYAPWKAKLTVEPVVTHRIIDIKMNEDKAYGLGRYTITCQGIAPEALKESQVINETNLFGKVVGQSQALGKAFSFATSIWGLIVLLGIPAIYLITTSIIDIVKASKMDEEKESATTLDEAYSKLSEEDKERLKKEMLEEMLEKKDDQNK